MNKQIEEMALDIHSASHLPLELCGALATDLVEAGYRKRSDGHWYKHDKKKHGDTCYYCSVCEKMALADCMTWELTNYCPNCGARMKGGETDA